MDFNLSLENYNLRIPFTCSLTISMKTDVLGVYDRPPTDPDAILLRKIGED